MNRKDTLLIDGSATMKTIRDRLKILFHDDVFPDLVFELAIDAWNVKFTCENHEDVLRSMVVDKIYRVLRNEDNEKNEIVSLIISCIKDILLDMEMIIYTSIPTNINHLQYLGMDRFNNISIKIIYDDLDENNII